MVINKLYAVLNTLSGAKNWILDHGLSMTELDRCTNHHTTIELFKAGGSSAMQLSNQSDTPEVLYNLFLRIKTGVPL